jgi:hypothetical protein
MPPKRVAAPLVLALGLSPIGTFSIMNRSVSSQLIRVLFLFGAIGHDDVPY